MGRDFESSFIRHDIARQENQDILDLQHRNEKFEERITALEGRIKDLTRVVDSLIYGQRG